jgi:non-ribosomal peptide synthetase component F
VEETRALEPEVTAALGEYSRSRKTTLNVLVQAAWALLLSRHSGERDVVFGASFAGRPADLSGVEGIVGPFVNNLPVRAQIDAAAPLAGLLHAMHTELFDLGEHQFTPLAQIQAWSELPWHARLFESLLVFQNYIIGDDAFRLGSDAILTDAVTPVRTNYPLTIVAEQGAQLRLTVIAYAHGISAQAAADLCAQLTTLLAAMPTAGTLGALLDLLPVRRIVAPERRPSADYAPPQTDTERAIAALWQEAFGLDRVGVRDNFFDLGGHSLLMVRVHARLRDALKTDISIVRMFQHPTIQSLARHLDGDPRATPVLAGVQARADKQKAALLRQRTLARRP